MDGATRNLESDNVSALAAAFPEVVADGKVDFEKLRLILGADIDDSEERYSFNWPGKRDAIKMAISRTTGTLRPDKENSKDWDTTENMFIEGDNLEVLRSLQNSYRGKVKMIYIDPPYNTGKDFVYKDDFKDNIRNYKENASLEGQSNPDTAGRYHTNWLNMMYPRLRLAKNLLKDDGVIFISIDDNEVHNLRKICDEIFGESNFLACLVWQNKEGGGSSDSLHFRIKHESVLCYARNKVAVSVLGVEISNLERYTETDEYFEERGPFYLQKLGMGSIQYSVSLDYEIETPDGTKVTPSDNNSGKRACWRWSSQKFEWGSKNGFIVIKKDRNEVWTVYTKQYLKSDNEGNIIERTQRPGGIINDYSSTQAAKHMENIGLGNYFSYTKPYALIKYLLNRVQTKSELVMDFFAGSATTAHAVMDLNAEDGGGRKFIMVQIPEATPENSEARKAKYNTISEISRKRIDLAGEKIKEDYKDKLAERETPLDIGFKAFTLDTTNFREWDTNTTNIEQSLLDALDTFKEGRNEEDALYEVLLKYGVDITEPVEELTLDGKKVYSLAGNYLLVCLEKSITLDTIEAMAALKPERVVCYDDGFADEDVKQNSLETLKRAGVTDVRVV